jgi:hypothetical protein
MNKKTIKNIIRIFFYCEAYIPNSRLPNFIDVKPMFSHLITEVEFQQILTSMNIEESHLHKQRFKLLSNIEELTAEVKRDLTPKQKLIFFTVLLKLVEVTKQATNLYLDDVLYCAKEAFDYSVEEINSIKKITFFDEPSESDYSDSLILTYEQPNYIDVINGLKIIHNCAFKFKIWIKNIKSVNHMLFKVIECHDHNSVFGFTKGEVFVYNREIQSLLNNYNLTINDLATKIISETNASMSIQIEPTSRSPRVILNSQQNRIEIEGVLMTNHADNFFDPIFYWLDKKKDQIPKSMEIHLNLTFFNTYASKIILQILNKVIVLEKPNTPAKYYWYSEDDDIEMKEAGEHYSAIINRQFIFIETCQNETKNFLGVTYN